MPAALDPADAGGLLRCSGSGLLLFAPQIADLAVGRDPSPDAVLVLRLSGLVLPFAALGDVLQSITRGFGRMRTTVMVERIGRPLAQLMLVVLAAPTHNVLLLVLAWTVPYLPATILSGLPVRRLARADRRRRSDARAVRLHPGRILAVHRPAGADCR